MITRTNSEVLPKIELETWEEEKKAIEIDEIKIELKVEEPQEKDEDNGLNPVTPICKEVADEKNCMPCLHPERSEESKYF